MWCCSYAVADNKTEWSDNSQGPFVPGQVWTVLLTELVSTWWVSVTGLHLLWKFPQEGCLQDHWLNMPIGEWSSYVCFDPQENLQCKLAPRVISHKMYRQNPALPQIRHLIRRCRQPQLFDWGIACYMFSSTQHYVLVMHLIQWFPNLLSSRFPWPTGPLAKVSY